MPPSRRRSVAMTRPARQPGLVSRAVRRVGQEIQVTRFQRAQARAQAGKPSLAERLGKSRSVDRMQEPRTVGFMDTLMNFFRLFFARRKR